MCSISENKIDTPFGLIETLRSAVDTGSARTATVYARALASFSSYLHGAGTSGLPLTSGSLTDWLVCMGYSGTAYSTAISYVNAVSGLYGNAVKAGLLPATDSFRQFRLSLRDFDSSSWPSGISQESFDRLVSHCRRADRLRGEVSLATDLVLYSLLNGCVPVMEAARVRRGESRAESPETEAVVSRQSSPGRRYVFALGQSRLTPRQLERQVRALVSGLFGWLGVPFFGSVDSTVRSYWSYSALRLGFSPSDVVSSLGCVPAGLPSLSLCRSGAIGAGLRERMRRDAGGVFVHNPRRWYAMRLRPRASYEDVVGRLSSFGPDVPAPGLFYPCDEIARRTGRRLTFRRQPVISDVVFFRSRVTDIRPIFSRIGDLAWCYTVPGEGGESYAAIPEREFREFQQAIGRFTPDYDVAPIGELPAGPNDRVVILGSAFQGLNAEVVDILRSPDGAGCIFRLHFIGQNGIDCRISIDPRMVRRLPPV